MGKRKAALLNLCQKFDIEILYSFGSRAQEAKDWLDETLPELLIGPPDLDIGVKPRTGGAFTIHEKVRLALELESLFNAQRVDLVTLRDADPFLTANIIRGERLYCVDETLADEYDLYILRRAGDLAPLERKRLDLILRSDR